MVRPFRPAVQTIRLCVFLMGVATLAALSAGAHAETLPAPAGSVILTVDGAIANTNAGKTATFDRDMLESIGMTVLTTSTPWESGRFRFEGVLLSRILSTVGATGTTLTVQGLDGYQVDVPAKDSREFEVILALKRDGAWMSVRDKGPIWIIYPIDRHPEIKNEFYSARSVWQVSRITVR